MEERDRDGFWPRSIELREGPGELDWTLLGSLHWVGEFRKKLVHLKVPDGFKTDLASVPRILTWLIPRYGKYTKAAVLHDYYCSYFANKQIALHPMRAPAFDEEDTATGEEETLELKDRSDADEIFRSTMKELGVSRTKRGYMWTAVSWATLSTCLWQGRGESPLLRWIGWMILFLVAVAAAVLVWMGAATLILNCDFSWRWVRIIVFACVVWAWISFSYIFAGYVAQGRWDRGPAYLGGFALSVPALPLVVPVVTIVLFFVLMWFTLPSETREEAPDAPPTPRQRRLAAVKAS